MLRPAGTLLPEKRKVGSSTLPLTTISQPGWLPALPAFGLFKGCFRLYFGRSAGVCRAVPSCPVGISWGGLEGGLVGFLWGTPEAVGGSRSRLSQDFGLRPLGRVRGPARVARNGQRG